MLLFYFLFLYWNRDVSESKIALNDLLYILNNVS